MFTPQLFSAVEGSILEQSERHIAYLQAQEDVRAAAVVYAVLPGIEVAWLDLAMNHFAPGKMTACTDAVELNHCKEGRAEFTMADGCVQFQGEGDLFISAKANHSERIALPLGFYRGVSLSIDWCVALAALQKELPELDEQLPALMERFLSSDDCFMIQANAALDALFAGMYAADAKIRWSYARLKALELILYLACFAVQEETQKSFYARQQVDIIKQVQKKITTDLSQRHTIDMLAKEFCISPTTLKEHFRGVYGQSIAAYLKSARMRRAAELLRQDTHSIGEIAHMVGYASQSKFGAAFREEMGATPSEYRHRDV